MKTICPPVGAWLADIGLNPGQWVSGGSLITGGKWQAACGTGGGVEASSPKSSDVGEHGLTVVHASRQRRA